MRSRRLLAIGVLIIAIGAGLRVWAVFWNTGIIHGDVITDAHMSHSLQQYGQFLSFPEGDDGSVMARGEPAAQRGPVWPILGSIIQIPWPASDVVQAHAALQVLSLLSGFLVLLLTYVVSTKLLNENAALLVTTGASMTYLLIDYSVNGSFYIFQTALYLLWVFVALKNPTRSRAVMLGAVSGVAYLVNFQSIILLPVTVIFLLCSSKRWKQNLTDTGIAFLTMAAVASPWLIRNALIFGDPFHSHGVNQAYLFIKAGFADSLVGPKPQANLHHWLSIFRDIITSWGPNNAYYVLRKLIVLLPVASLLFAYGLIDVAFDRKRFRHLFPVLLLLAAHVAISIAWPVMKFRYLVPMMPFVLLLAAEELMHLKISQRTRQVIVTVTFVGFLIVGVLTWRSVPTHTAYYDGAITQDAFHGFEERTFLEKQGFIPQRQQ